jgi:CAAX protease family protein
VQFITAWIKRHPVVAYYVATFVISWGGILIVVGGPGGFPGAPDKFLTDLPALLVAMLLGPTIAGVLMTTLVDGRNGLRALFSSLGRWRAPLRWWLVALLTAPLVMTVVPMVVALFAPQYMPGIFATADKAPLIGMGIGAGLSTLLEEIGWTGFAIPQLRKRYGVLRTGLIAGVLWAGWHLLVNFWSSGTASRELALAPLLTSLFFSWGILTAFRVLMVWVYGHAPSVLIAWLMHATLTSSNVILAPLTPQGVTGPAWSLMVAAALWVVVAVVARTGGLEARDPI